MSSSILRSVLFVLMLGLLTFPVIQDLTHVLKPTPLHGDIADPVLASFSWQKWWAGSYQDSMTEYAKGMTGMRPDITRLANQIDYSVFNKVHAHGVLIGREGYLYEDGYLDRYCGKSPRPYSEWQIKLSKLKKVQDTLASLGICILTMQAGSKATYYPEYFPDDWRCDQRPVNDHDILNHIADSLHLNYIDINNWFLSMKGKSPGPLFTKQGIHWSKYGAVMAADSFVRYLRAHDSMDLPDLKWKKGPKFTKPQGTDYDVLQGLNLMIEPEKGVFYYPSISYEGEHRVKPKMIFIADSYMWTWMLQGIPHNLSTDWEFWYYYNDSFTPDGSHKVKPDHWQKPMVQSKVILLMFSECNISTFSWGFIENAYLYFYGEDRPSGVI